MTYDYQAIVIGGGLSGLLMTIALGRAGIDVLCLDRGQIRNDQRTTAIAQGSQRIIKRLGIWESLEAEAIKEIRVVEGGAFTHYDYREVGGEPLGWIVENRLLYECLLREVGRLSRARQVAPAEVVEIERDRWKVAVTVKGYRRPFRGQIVIGADGRGSLVRESAGIEVTFKRYDQMAMACTIAHTQPHHGLALERFFPSGPFAVLPMTKRRSSIIWSDSRPMTQYLTLEKREFERVLRDRIGSYLGEIDLLGSRVAHPLSLIYAHRQIDRRLALIAEAAHGIHPVAGQGLNMGIRDIAVLAEVLLDAYRLGGDIGEDSILERYQQWRRLDNFSLVFICDHLIDIFSNRFTPLRMIRGMGLSIINNSPPLKRFFMRYAMGILGDLPRLSR